jgi:hypothetical protein
MSKNSIPKDWREQHFKVPDKEPPPKKIPWIIIIVLTLVLSSAGIGTAHYLGVIDTRVWYNKAVSWIMRTGDDAGKLAESFINDEPSPDIASVAIAQPTPESESSPESVIDNKPQTTKKIMSASRRKELESGLSMLKRDLTNVHNEMKPRQEQLTIHSPHWRPPTSAERNFIASEYLKKNPNLPNETRFRLNDILYNTNAQIKNHRMRIAELEELVESLKKRIVSVEQKLAQ